MSLAKLTHRSLELSHILRNTKPTKKRNNKRKKTIHNIKRKFQIQEKTEYIWIRKFTILLYTVVGYKHTYFIYMSIYISVAGCTECVISKMRLKGLK